ncbi:MAG TPA: ABC transporter permease [Natronosporangium sp.]
MRLVRAELLKLRTTSAAWWLGVGSLVATALALPLNILLADQFLGSPPDTQGLDPVDAEALLAQQDIGVQAANIYTSGQHFGLLLVLVVGILLLTGEFHHQTVTTTFLTTPQRPRVIISKFIAAVLVAVLFWAVTTVINLVVGALWLNAAGYGHQLGEWDVIRSILLNLLAYAIWAIFGVAFGTLITNQLGAVVTASALYLIGTQAASVIFYALSRWLDNPTILEWQVIVPSIASMLMITGGEDIPGSPPQWVGAVILIGYAVVTGTLGTLITRKRDIS